MKLMYKTNNDYYDINGMLEIINRAFNDTADASFANMVSSVILSEGISKLKSEVPFTDEQIENARHRSTNSIIAEDLSMLLKNCAISICKEYPYNSILTFIKIVPSCYQVIDAEMDDVEEDDEDDFDEVGYDPFSGSYTDDV